MANISIDYYGTLAQYAPFWKKFLEYAVMEGHYITVLTGNWEIPVFEGLKELGYKSQTHFHHMASILRLLKDMGFKVWLDEAHDSWFAHEDAWWAAKSAFCETANIALHFDNDIRFARGFSEIPTRFVHTESAKGESIIKDWYNRLEIANTFSDDPADDDMFDYYGIGGIVPM